MRIGIDARLWDQTGVGRYIRNLIKNLLILDKNNTYVLFIRKQDYGIINEQLSIIKHQNKLEIGNWKLEIVDIKWHSLAEQILFPKILEKEKLDLVHFPYFSVPIFYSKPYVVTIHDLIINHFPTGKASTRFFPLYLLKLFGYKKLIKIIAQKSVKIIAPSFATKIEIIEHLKIPENKIAVTYEAADDKLKIENLKLKIGKYGKYFLYVGNAYPHKNLENLLLAFADYKKNSGEGKLILVGSIDYFYLKLKEKAKELNITNNVIFFGKASDNQLLNLYKNAIALILPSKMEGFGLPVLEAMVNNCLVLASDIPSVREIAADNAFYFNPFNINEIVDAFKKAVDNKERNKILDMVEKNYKRSLEFSWEEMAKETLKIYTSAGSV